MNEKDIKKIIVVYEDGSQAETDKGCVFQFRDVREDQVTVTSYMVGMSGRDLHLIVEAVFELGGRLGMFCTEDEDDEEI